MSSHSIRDVPILNRHHNASDDRGENVNLLPYLFEQSFPNTVSFESSEVRLSSTFASFQFSGLLNILSF